MAGTTSAANASRSIPERGDALRDSLFLLLVVCLSVAPYVSRLGFYSDDWAFLAALVHAPDHSLGAMWDAQYTQSVSLRRRPTQIVYQSVLFRAFALNPLGYHAVNNAVLALAALLLYFVLREYDLQRAIAIAIAVVYILLPNYSVARFWFATFFYPLTIALFLLSAYAFLRALRSQHPGGWILLGVGLLGAAALGSETVVPLMAALPVALWLRLQQLHRDQSFRQLAMTSGIVLLTPVIVVVLTILYKASAGGASVIPDIVRMAFVSIGAVAVNFGTYGIGLPHTVSWAVSQLSWVDLVLGTVLAVVVFSYVSYISRSIAPPAAARHDWTKLALLGASIFVLGMSIFLIAPTVAFWSAGIANRVWITASIGMAFIWVALTGWLSSWLSNWTRFNRAFGGLIACLCVSSFVINSALSTFWVAAWPRQLEVLNDIRGAAPKIDPGTDFILHGVCPYIGPAIVFESNWDLAGAIKIIYRDRTLGADVTTGDFTIGQDGLRTQLYSKSYFHPYGDKLLLFDHSSRTVHRLTNADQAQRYLSERPTCPGGAEGRGTLILPVDVLYSKGFRPWR